MLHGLQQCVSYIINRKRETLCLFFICLSQVVLFSTAQFTNGNPHQTLVVGKSGILNCSAEGNPAPRFTWTKTGGKALDKKRFIQQPNGNIYVNPVLLIDEGEHICTIEQNRGTTRTTTKRQTITVSIVGKKSSFRKVMLILL